MLFEVFCSILAPGHVNPIKSVCGCSDYFVLKADLLTSNMLPLWKKKVKNKIN